MGKSVAIAIIVMGLIYLGAAFVALSIDPHDWSDELRAFAAFFGLPLSALAFAIACGFFAGGEK